MNRPDLLDMRCIPDNRWVWGVLGMLAYDLTGHGGAAEFMGFEYAPPQSA